MNKRILYAVALLEGFSTLAVEIIGLRMAAPLVGSSIILTSIYLGIILCALSVGYYVGGILTTKVHKGQLRKLLGGYLLVSALWYLFISFGQATILLGRMLNTVDNYVLTLFLTALILFFMPVFLASQTLPLLTELLPDQSKGKSAGVILFASTMGSFLGSVLTSIVLFEHIGVQATGIVVTCGLFFAVTLLWFPHKKRRSLATLLGGISIAIFGIRVFPAPNSLLTYSFDSAYQTIEILQGYARGGPIRIFQMNGAFSSGINPETMKSPFQYIREFVAITEKHQPKNILVIGAAGFVYPYEVAQLPYVERIDTIDIDPQVKTIAENKFLFQTLSPKIVFYPESARRFINQAIKNNTTYDLIILDAYNGKSIPDELTTVEFFNGVQQLLTPDGKLAANFILDTKLQTAFAKNLLSSFAHVFGAVYTNNISAGEEQHSHDNFIVSSEPLDGNFFLHKPSGIVYTDNLRTTETDIVQMFWGG